MVSRPSEVLAREVRRWRQERKLSAQDLANRLADLGSDLNRRVISKIENGERGVSLDEWLQLAHALAVPPPLLLLDLTAGTTAEIAPRVALHPWIIWEWITGEHPPPVSAPEGGAYVSRVEEFSRAKTAIFLYQHERKCADAVSRSIVDIRTAEYAGAEAGVTAARSAHVDALRELATVLDEMVANGVTPPGKPREWIETIRSLGLSKYPDALVIYETQEGATSGGPDQAG